MREKLQRQLIGMTNDYRYIKFSKMIKGENKMKISNILATSITFLALGLVASQAAPIWDAVPLENPSFEDTAPGSIQLPWVSTTSGGDSYTSIGEFPSAPDGNQAASVYADKYGTSAKIHQDVLKDDGTPWTVSAGEDYRMSVWYKGYEYNGYEIMTHSLILVDPNDDQNTYVLGEGPGDGGYAADTWREWNLDQDAQTQLESRGDDNWLTDYDDVNLKIPETVPAEYDGWNLRVQIEARDNRTGNEVDMMTVEYIPEPSTLTLLFCLGVGLQMRRPPRRRR